LKTTPIKAKRPLRVVFFCTLILSIILGCYNFWEWFAVEKLDQIQGYDFRVVDGRAYYYQSKALYAFIHLFWSICFAVSTALMLVSFVFIAKWYKIVSLIISLIVTGVYCFHAVIA